MTKRSCIENLQTQARFLEMNWGEPRPSLFNWLDQGSDGWQNKLKLFYKHRVRGSEVFDPPHRHVRNREKALGGAGFSFIKTEFSTVFTFLHGPWGSMANFQLVKGAKTEIFASFDHTFALYRALVFSASRTAHSTRLSLTTNTHLCMNTHINQIRSKSQGPETDVYTFHSSVTAANFLVGVVSADLVVV